VIGNIFIALTFRELDFRPSVLLELCLGRRYLSEGALTASQYAVPTNHYPLLASRIRVTGNSVVMGGLKTGRGLCSAARSQ